MRHCLFVTWLAFAAVIAAHVQAAPYRYVTFDVPASTSTRLEGINNQGHIVGTYVGASGSGVFVFDGTEFIPMPPFDDHGVFPSDINDQGQIVGTLIPPSVGGIVPGSRGFLFDNGAYTALTFPGSAFTSASGLNNQGQIVGAQRTGPGLTRARGFSFDGIEFTAIEVPNSIENGAASVNDDGTVVGTFHPNNLLIGYGYLLRDAQIEVLDTPFSEQFVPDDINSDGILAGTYLYSAFDGFHQGFILDGEEWSPIHFPGSLETFVGGINDDNQVVGTYRTSDGRFRGFIANPVPEPTTLVLFLAFAAICGAICGLRRRI